MTPELAAQGAGACTHEYQIPMDRCCIRCGQSNLLDYISSLRQARREELSAVWQAATQAAAQLLDQRVTHWEYLATTTKDDIVKDYAAESRTAARAIRALASPFANRP